MSRIRGIARICAGEGRFFEYVVQFEEPSAFGCGITRSHFHKSEMRIIERVIHETESGGTDIDPSATPLIALMCRLRKCVNTLAIWKVRQARDLAWDFADHLRLSGPLKRKLALLTQDKLTGVISRSLLLHF